MSVLFEKMKNFYGNDELVMDFLDFSRKDNEICCKEDDFFDGVVYCGRCSEKCSAIQVQFFIKLKKRTNLKNKKKRFFVTHYIENTDIFGNLYDKYFNLAKKFGQFLF